MASLMHIDIEALPSQVGLCCRSVDLELCEVAATNLYPCLVLCHMIGCAAFLEYGRLSIARVVARFHAPSLARGLAAETRLVHPNAVRKPSVACTVWACLDVAFEAFREKNNRERGCPCSPSVDCEAVIVLVIDGSMGGASPSVCAATSTIRRS